MINPANASQSKNPDNNASKQDSHGTDGKTSLLSKLIEKSQDREAIWGVLGLIAGGLMAYQIAKGDAVTAISAGVAMFAGIIVWQEARHGARGARRKQPFTTQCLKGISVAAFAIVLLLLIVKLSLRLFPLTARDAGFQTISDFLNYPLSLFSPGTVTVEVSATETSADNQLYISVESIDYADGVDAVSFTIGVAGGTTQSYEKKHVGYTVSVSGHEVRVMQIELRHASFHIIRVRDPAKASSPPAPTTPQTTTSGNATTYGHESPAITGGNATVTYDGRGAGKETKSESSK